MNSVSAAWGRGNGVGRKMFRESQRKKDRKIAKTDRKIALLSLYLLNLCHV